MSNEQAGKDLKWKQFNVGSGGNVCLVDWMGEDYSIVEAARVSYGEGTQHTSGDRQLIRYLMRHWHTTPFEMAVVKLRVRVPMDTWRQWIRHRTASVNEYSTRYSVAIDEFAATSPEDWRLQAESNRQGSDGLFSLEEGEELSEAEASFHALARGLYESRLDKGVAREQARKDLPLSNYTEAYWKIDLHNLFHFLRLRMDSHAQKEIRDFAEIIGKEIVAKLFPHAWEAFVDYRLEAMQLTRLEIGVVQRMLIEASSVNRTSTLMANFKKCQDPSWKRLKKCRERDECLEKLEILGVFPNGSAKS